MKILVTGASGFVGKKIVEEAVKTGAEIFTSGQSPAANLPNYYRADITSKESVEKLFSNVGILNCVIHSAGLAHQFRSPADQGIFHRINVEGTRNIAEAAAKAGCTKFILISSISVYGDGKPNPCTEDAICEPNGDYAVSKLGAETAAREICRQHGMDLVILRLATVYGEGDVGNVRRLIKLVAGRKFVWAGKGANSKSLIYNGDAARACRMVLEKDLHGENIYNVTDEPHTMKEIVEAIAQSLGRKTPSISIPEKWLNTAFQTAGYLPLAGGKARGLKQTLKKWLSDDVLSGEKIKKELGFAAQTPLADGIDSEVKWLRNAK